MATMGSGAASVLLALCAVVCVSRACFSPAAKELLRDKAAFDARRASDECVQQFDNITRSGQVPVLANDSSPLFSVCSERTLVGRRHCAMQCRLCPLYAEGAKLTEIACGAKLEPAELRCACTFGDSECEPTVSDLLKVAGDYKKECVADAEQGDVSRDDIEALLDAKAAASPAANETAVE